MEPFNLIVTLLGGLILLLGLASKRLAKSPLPPTLVALAIGVLLGPQALNLIDLAQLGERTTILERAARLTLGIGLMGVALRIPREYPRRQWRTVLVLIGPGMLLMWGISALLVALILCLPLGLAAIIGAIITPTDPVAASPIVTGDLAKENIPGRVRHAISFDSGANDGLSYLFVFLPFLLLTRPAGAAFAQVVSSEDRENEEHGQEAVNRFFSVPIFALLGLALPWEGWRALGWGGVLLAVAVLLLRRPPVLLLLRPLLPGIRSTPEALFVGWFGPIAVAAIYYAAVMEHRLAEPLIWHVVSLVICASLIAHGVSGAPLTQLYGKAAELRSGQTAGPPEAEASRD